MRSSPLLLLFLAAPAAFLPPAPPPAAPDVAACPLWWAPGEPAALYPHPRAEPADRGGGVRDASGAAELSDARGWIEVGLPERALAALEGVPDGPARRLYRIAALDGLARWPELQAALANTPPARLPAGCGPLHDLWSARATLTTGGEAESDRAFERLAASSPSLGAWMDLLRLEAAAAAGDLARGETAWMRIQAGSLPAIAREDARDLLPELHERAGRLDDAIAWHLSLADAARGSERARHWLDAARVADRLGDPARGDALRRRVLVQEPAHAASVALDPDLRARMGIEPLAAARALAESGYAAEVEAFATTALSGATTARAQEATLLRARARLARGDRQGADEDYAAFLSGWPSDPRAPDAAFERARLALADGRGDLARQRLEEFRARWPSHERADDALYLIADAWHDEWRGDPAVGTRAIAAFDRLVAERPQSTFADRSKMRAAHLAFALGRHAEAERRYRAYRGPSSREARYWTARARDAQGDRTGALAIWRELARGGDEYYAILSRERVRGGAGLTALLPSDYAPAPRPAYASGGDVVLASSRGRTAAALLALGRRRWAQAELERGLAAAAGDRERERAWAAALEAWGFPELTLRIGVRLGHERFSHPAGFASTLDREARAHGLDGAWVAALIRQESMYRARAVSPVGARGLMQIMPATGREIAAAEAWPAFDTQSLFDPAVSLHFGHAYLAEQRARFGGFWPAVLAAYNAGPDRVAAWIAFPEREMDAELWVDRIPFKETREYVRKIVGQWAAYRRLYGPPPPAS